MAARLGSLRPVWVISLIVAALGVAATAALLVFGGSGSLVNRVVGFTFGTPTTADVASSCESWVNRGGPEPNDSFDCDGSTWSVYGKEVTGTVVARLKHLTPDGPLVDQLPVRALGDAAFGKPTAADYGLVAAVVALVVIGVVVAAVALVGQALLRRRPTAAGNTDPDYASALQQVQRHNLAPVIGTYRTEGSAMKGVSVIGGAELALAALAGVTASLATAEGKMDRLVAIAIAVGAIGLVGIQLFRWYARKRDAPHGLACVCEHGLVVSERDKSFVSRWSEASFIGSPDTLTPEIKVAPFAVRNQNGATYSFDEWAWEKPDLLRTQIYDKIHAAVRERILADFEAGRKVAFGTTIVSRDGITRDGVTLRYGEIRSITQDAKGLHVLPRRAATPPLFLSVTSTPNFELLVEVLTRTPAGLRTLRQS